MHKSLFLFILIFLFNSPCYATRIKDIATINGDRVNLLVGYGLVVGLNGTGDNLKNAIFTQKGLIEFLERLGVNIQGATNLKTKNIAAVTVTADLPPFARQGTKLDVKVSALGDAKSLRGGTLLATPLLGPDGNVYALSQGLITLSEFEPASENVKTQPAPKLENNGYISNGAVVEEELDFSYNNLSHLKFTLHNPDSATSLAVAEAINNSIPGNTAIALDPASIQVTIPNYRREDIIQFIADIEALTIAPDYKAKIVINEASGTIVIGDNVKIRPVAIAQGNLVVNIAPGETATAQMPAAKQQQINQFVDKKRGKEFDYFAGNANLSELIAGLNKLGVWPRDIINVLYSMKAVGALDAIIEVR